MGDIYAILALRRKRARLAGEIAAAENVLAKMRYTLATLDSVIRVFEPSSNPEMIAAIRPRSRTALFFRRGEQSRLCLAALHGAGTPLPARQLADYAMQAKGLDVDMPVRAVIDNQIRQTLLRMESKGVVRRIISHPDVWWELAEAAP